MHAHTNALPIGTDGYASLWDTTLLPQGDPTLRGRLEFGLRMVKSPAATLGASFWPAFTLQHHAGSLAARLYALCRRLQDGLAKRSSVEGERNIG